MSAALPQRIDFLRIAMNLGGNRETISKMLDLFLKSIAASIEHLEAAERSSNVIIWLQTAHKIKGAAQNMTAQRLIMLCLEAEEIQSLPHSQSSSVLYNMSKELAILREMINKHQQERR